VVLGRTGGVDGTHVDCARNGRERILHGAWALQPGKSPREGMSTHLWVNHQLESRMREIRQSGLEGGGAHKALPTPIKPRLRGSASYPAMVFVFYAEGVVTVRL